MKLLQGFGEGQQSRLHPVFGKPGKVLLMEGEEGNPMTGPLSSRWGLDGGTAHDSRESWERAWVQADPTSVY